MKFRVDHGQFQARLAWAARAIAVRATEPILSGVLLEAREGKLEMSSFNYESSSTGNLEADISTPGRILVPGKLLLEIVKSLPDLPIEMESTPEGLRINCGNGSYVLAKLPLEKFPVLPTMAPATGVVPTADFSKAIRRIAHSASRENALPFLTGAHIQSSREKISLVATDRFRIAISEVSWLPQRQYSENEKYTAIVPMKELADSFRSIDPDGSTAISFPDEFQPNKATFGISFGDQSSTTRVIDSHLIDPTNHMPTDFSFSASIDTQMLVSSLKRVSLFSDLRSPVNLEFAANGLQVSAGLPDSSGAVEYVPAETSGADNFSIAFNAKYLIDGLTAIESKSARMDFTSPNGRAQITPDGNHPKGQDQSNKLERFTYIVMPTRI